MILPTFPPPRPPRSILSLLQVLLPALRVHVQFLHLHRIAAIVLLRMLQEAAVARDIAVHGGVVIMLGMLREHAREEETVAASVHILYLITHADVMRGAVELEVGDSRWRVEGGWGVKAYPTKIPPLEAILPLLVHAGKRLTTQGACEAARVAGVSVSMVCDALTST